MINTQRVRERLKALRLTANAASEAAGLGRSYLRDVLGGRIKEPSALRLLRIADVLKCSPDYLLGKENGPWPNGLLPADDRNSALVDDVADQIAHAHATDTPSRRLMFDLLDAVDERTLVEMVYGYISQSAYLALLSLGTLSESQTAFLCGPQDSAEEQDVMRRVIACRLAGLIGEDTVHKTTLLTVLHGIMLAPGGPSNFDAPAVREAVAFQLKAAGLKSEPTNELARLTILSLFAEYLQLPEPPG